MAKIRNRYIKHHTLFKIPMGKWQRHKLDITNESQEVSPFPAGDNKTPTNRRAWKHTKTKQK